MSDEELPEAMPEDFPIPAGAVVDYVSEMGYDFSLNFVIDSGFETTAETFWEHGTFIPGGSPNDPAFEQTKETMTVEVFWTDFGLLNKNG